MQQINILGVSHNKREPKGYYMLREEGLPAFCFIHFILPAVVVIDGYEHITQSNACIIYSPGTRQEMKAHNGIFVNDFLVFKTSDINFIARYELPENEIFYINNGDEVTRILEHITWAVTDKMEPHGDDIIEGVNRLFTAISKLYIESNPQVKRAFEVKRRFINLRKEMRENPTAWTINSMAKHVWLARSRFIVLYKSMFNISPNADLMDMKIEYAKKLLKTTDASVANISAMCGYTSVEYFIRLFNKSTNITPLQYRKQHQNEPYSTADSTIAK